MDYREKYGKVCGVRKSPTDKRDYKLKKHIKLGAIQIPKEYETEEFPFIYDQGDTQMCCACAYNAIRYLQESDSSQSELKEPFSPAFTYGIRNKNEIFEGMYIRSCCKNGKKGSLLYRELPGFYNVKDAIQLVNNKKDEYYKKAENFKINSYYVCTERKEIQSAIITAKGVITGINLYDSFYDVKNDGIINYHNEKDEDGYGGHAIAITGWKEINNKFYWRILNSWGKDWGDNGYGWLDGNYPFIDDAYAFIDDYTREKYSDYIVEYYNNNNH